MPQNPPSPEDQYNTARKLLDEGKPSQALLAWIELGKLVGEDIKSPLFVTAVHQKAVCYRLLGDAETAGCTFNRAFGYAKNGGHTLIALAIQRDWSALLLDQAHYQQALKRIAYADKLAAGLDTQFIQSRINEGYRGRVYGRSRDATLQRKARSCLRKADKALRQHPEFSAQYLNNRIWMLEPPTFWRFVYAPQTVALAIWQHKWRRLIEILALLIGGTKLRAKLRQLLR